MIMSNYTSVLELTIVPKQPTPSLAVLIEDTDAFRNYVNAPIHRLGWAHTSIEFRHGYVRIAGDRVQNGEQFHYLIVGNVSDYFVTSHREALIVDAQTLFNSYDIQKATIQHLYGG